MKTTTLKIHAALAGAAMAVFATLPLAHAGYPDTVLAQSPTGYWQVNETIQPQNTTNAVNLGSLGASAIGTYNNYASGGSPGPFSGSTAVGLDGSLQSVTSPYQTALNPAQFTIEAWVNPSSATVSGGLLCVASSMYSTSPRQGWLIYQSDGTAAGAAGVGYYLRLYATNGTAQSISLLAPQTVTPGTWTHLVFSFDGTTAKAYINGVPVGSGVPTANAAGLRFIPNTSAQFAVGMRSDAGFAWPGKAAEVAYYGNALSDTRVASHYTAATTAPGTYQATVLADSPLLYYRFTESGSPSTANVGTLGSAANGIWLYSATAGQAGPRPATFPGFTSGNNAATFDGTGGAIRIPALNLNTNAVTISAWVKANGSQAQSAGLVVNGSGATASGLTMDRVFPGYGLGYVWAGNDYGVSFQNDLGLSPVPDNAWTFVALVIEPNKARIYNSGGSDYNNFVWAENTFNVSHPVQTFSSPTLIGTESGFANRTFKGGIDEVAIFNRALSAGELYTQFATGVGGVPPRVFDLLSGPTGPVAAGDPIVLKVDAGGTPPLSYVWQRSGTNFATTSTGVLTIGTSALADTDTYRVNVSNASGSDVYGGDLYVQVVTPSSPAIVSTEGFLNRSIYPGGSLRMSVTATGGGLKYQWYKNAAAIAGATGSAYAVTPVTNTSAGNYSVFITNVVGNLSNGPVAITVPTPAAGSYASNIVFSAPQAWWRLDDTAGSTRLLDSMGRHDGSYTNLNSTVPPVVLGVPGALLGDANTAASFSGSGGLGVIPYSGELNTTKFTYEAWVRTTVTTDQNLVPVSSSTSASGNWWRTFPAGQWAPGGNSGYAPIFDNGNTQAAIVPSAWTHLVMCYDSTRVISGTQYPWTYFVNGVTDGFVWTGATATTDGSYIIGGRGRTGSPIADMFFNGQVDEVAVYQRVLATTEIQAHYAARGVEILPPTFATPLLSQTVTAGKTVTFSTTVLGTSPALQWLKGVTPITDATNNSLTLSNVTIADAGLYTLRASNAASTNTTSATLTVIAPVNYANVTNNLVMHLRGDGNTSDSSGRGNNGTVVGAIAYPPGIIGTGAVQYQTQVDGTGTNVSSASFVRLGSPGDLRFGTATSFSVGMWVKLSVGNLDGDLPFIGNATNSMNNPGWVLGPTYKTGGWQFSLGDGTNSLAVGGAANSINSGGWQHFVLVVDRTAKLANSYLNGVLVASRDITTMGSLDNAVGAPIVIGQDPTGLYPEPGSAILDDIGVWRRALTPLEVAQIESAGVTTGNSFDTTGPSVVPLSITRSGGNLMLGWPSGTLLQSDTLGATAVWTAVPGASAPSHTVTPTGASKYYKVGTP